MSWKGTTVRRIREQEAGAFKGSAQLPGESTTLQSTTEKVQMVLSNVDYSRAGRLRAASLSRPDIAVISGARDRRIGGLSARVDERRRAAPLDARPADRPCPSEK
jgi:hypothetical protein